MKFQLANYCVERSVLTRREKAERLTRCLEQLHLPMWKRESGVAKAVASSKGSLWHFHTFPFFGCVQKANPAGPKGKQCIFDDRIAIFRNILMTAAVFHTGQQEAAGRLHSQDQGATMSSLLHWAGDVVFDLQSSVAFCCCPSLEGRGCVPAFLGGLGVCPGLGQGGHRLRARVGHRNRQGRQPRAGGGDAEGHPRLPLRGVGKGILQDHPMAA